MKVTKETISYILERLPSEDQLRQISIVEKWPVDGTDTFILMFGDIRNAVEKAVADYGDKLVQQFKEWNSTQVDSDGTF
jgi:hypothetical protein